MYYAIVHKDDDSAWGISFPDLPGCFSAADEEADIIRNAQEALALWFEDQAVVPASPLEKVRAAAAEDLADGAFIIGVPWILSSGRAMRVNITLDEGLLKAIDRNSSNRSGFLADAAREKLLAG